MPRPQHSQPTAAEVEEAVEQARKLEGIVDILWIRVDEHPSAWTQDKGRPKSLAYAEAIKKAGIKIITCPSAGFHDPVENDGFIASGKTDMVGMTMPFFADPELVRKVKEGRADDVIPCIACQNCHGISMNKPPWYSTCTVNPIWGLPPYQLQGHHETDDIQEGCRDRRRPGRHEGGHGGSRKRPQGDPVREGCNPGRAAQDLGQQQVEMEL